MTDNAVALRAAVAAWFEEYPFEPSRDELSGSGDYDCYACGQHVHIDIDYTAPEWWNQRPDADAGHADDCLWVKAKALL